MPRRRPRRSLPVKTTRTGTFRVNKPGKFAQRIELYSAAYKLALQQIPPMRAKPDIFLRIHASIRRQLRAGETDPRRIAFAALKDALVPDTT
jgi:hypothetical protein